VIGHSIITIININMLMPVPLIVLYIIKETYWYSTHRGMMAQSS